IQKDSQVIVSGVYPDARYASLNVYTITGASFTNNGVGSSLPDYRIAPDPGSHNPWQHPAAPGGRYHVTLRSDVSPGQINVLPLAPTGTASGVGYIVYR